MPSADEPAQRGSVMKASPLAISEVVLIEPRVFGAVRGFFFESFNQRRFDAAGG